MHNIEKQWVHCKSHIGWFTAVLCHILHHMVFGIIKYVLYSYYIIIINIEFGIRWFYWQRHKNAKETPRWNRAILLPPTL